MAKCDWPGQITRRAAGSDPASVFIVVGIGSQMSAPCMISVGTVIVADGGSVAYRRRSGGACFVLSLPAASRDREMARALERTSGDSACGETVP
ncbi:hypothetical protein BC793_106228 [Actinoplanes xinjiangensis]|uniref:Uncharacterized protein n=1 Tax=Actinoplanes xinjiangensis TaxID=512350 RepID=A0A316FH03_9ACTN|nr:hypothetical protein BC793_106228 [Actinoplanes xinjiangensis]